MVTASKKHCTCYDIDSNVMRAQKSSSEMKLMYIENLEQYENESDTYNPRPRTTDLFI